MSDLARGSKRTDGMVAIAEIQSNREAAGKHRGSRGKNEGGWGFSWFFHRQRMVTQ